MVLVGARDLVLEGGARRNDDRSGDIARPESADTVMQSPRLMPLSLVIQLLSDVQYAFRGDAL